MSDLGKKIYKIIKDGVHIVINLHNSITNKMSQSHRNVANIQLHMFSLRRRFRGGVLQIWRPVIQAAGKRAELP